MRLLAVMAVAVGWSAALGAAAAPAPVAAKRLADAAFAPSPTSASDPFKDLLEADLYDSGPGAARWTNATSAVVAGKARRGSIDTLRFSVTDQPEAVRHHAVMVDHHRRALLAVTGSQREDLPLASQHLGCVRCHAVSHCDALTAQGAVAIQNSRLPMTWEGELGAARAPLLPLQLPASPDTPNRVP